MCDVKLTFKISQTTVKYLHFLNFNTSLLL